MPGMKPSDASWRWTSPFKALRQVTAADASLAAVTEVVDLSKPSSVDVNKLQQGYDNVLYLGILFPVGVTSARVQVFVDAMPVNNAGDDVPAGWSALATPQYALLKDVTVTEAGVIAIRDVFPANMKIMVKAMAGTGTISIVYSRSE